MAPTTPLVNSVKFVYTSGGGSDLTGALLATNNTSVIQGLIKPVAVWNFSGPTFASCTLTIRYDDVTAGNLSLAPGDLKVFQNVGGAWKDITGTVTPGTHTITANAQSPLSQFAIAADVLRRGTVISIR